MSRVERVVCWFLIGVGAGALWVAMNKVQELKDELEYRM